MQKTSDVVKAIEQGCTVIQNESGNHYTELATLLENFPTFLANHPEEFTIIKPKKKVKYEAWEDIEGELRFWSRIAPHKHQKIKRIPEADKEYEIEEK